MRREDVKYPSRFIGSLLAPGLAGRLAPAAALGVVIVGVVGGAAFSDGAHGKLFFGFGGLLLLFLCGLENSESVCEALGKGLGDIRLLVLEVRPQVSHLGAQFLFICAHLRQEFGFGGGHFLREEGSVLAHPVFYFIKLGVDYSPQPEEEHDQDPKKREPQALIESEPVPDGLEPLCLQFFQHRGSVVGGHGRLPGRLFPSGIPGPARKFYHISIGYS